ncbi:hypothetical protein YC2023_052272 [Brassica napus]
MRLVSKTIKRSLVDVESCGSTPGYGHEDGSFESDSLIKLNNSKKMVADVATNPCHKKK